MDLNKLYEKFKKILTVISNLLNDALRSQRDRRALIIGVVVVLLFILFFSYRSFSKSSSRYEKQVQVLENNLVEIRSLKKDYKASKDRLKELTKTVKKEEEALISVVEEILVDNQIERTSFSLKDSNISSGSEELYDETSVQVDIRKVPLYKVVDVLYKIQTRDSFLKVSNLRIKTKFDKPDLIDASFRLSTFEFKKVI